jgi:hypothetical protein
MLPVVIFALGVLQPVLADEMASATLSSTELSPGLWQYNLTLDDTGTTNVGTLWFSWIPGEDFMPTDPSDVTGPASWTDTITGGGTGDGYAIRWVAGTGVALTAGESIAGFSFESTTSPTTMAGTSPFHPEPVLTSFIYSGAPFSDSGYQFQVQQVSGAPEPATGWLFLVCGSGLMAIRRLRVKNGKKPAPQ